MNPLQIANQIEIEKLKSQNEKMKKLANREDFFKQYFLECKNYKTNKDAFDAVNEEYYNYFGQYRYSDFHTFKRVVIYYNQKK